MGARSGVQNLFAGPEQKSGERKTRKESTEFTEVRRLFAIDQSLEPGFQLCRTKIKKVAEPEALYLPTLREHRDHRASFSRSGKQWKSLVTKTAFANSTGAMKLRSEKSISQWRTFQFGSVLT